MTWAKISNKTTKPDNCTMGITYEGKGNRLVTHITFSPHYLKVMKPTRANIFVGEGEHAGFVKIDVTDTGEYKLRAKSSRLGVWFAPTLPLPLAAKPRVNVEVRREGVDTFIVTVPPEWFHQIKPVAVLSDEQREALKVKGPGQMYLTEMAPEPEIVNLPPVEAPRQNVVWDKEAPLRTEMFEEKKKAIREQVTPKVGNDTTESYERKYGRDMKVPAHIKEKPPQPAPQAVIEKFKALVEEVKAQEPAPHHRAREARQSVADAGLKQAKKVGIFNRDTSQAEPAPAWRGKTTQTGNIRTVDIGPEIYQLVGNYLFEKSSKGILLTFKVDEANIMRVLMTNFNSTTHRADIRGMTPDIDLAIGKIRAKLATTRMKLTTEGPITKGWVLEERTPE